MAIFEGNIASKKSPLTSTMPTSTQPRVESTIAPYYTGLNGVNGKTNMLCRDILWGSLGLVVLVTLCLRIMEGTWNKMRQTSVLAAPTGNQSSWKAPRTNWTAKFKKHLIYASAWKKRHHREYRFLSLNFGTLPSRLHSIFIAGYLASNLAYLLVLNWDNPNRYAVCAELRGRTGTLCVANMVPLVILAGRNNPLIPLLKISFDTYNLFHRWVGRITVFEIILHAICWAVPVIADGGWGLMGKKIAGNLFLASGLTGVLCMCLILILSLSPIRHAFYETFLDIHILLACIAFTCTWIHCASSAIEGGLPQLPWIMAVVYLWVADRLLRIARTLYINWKGKNITTAFCEAMPGDVTRVTLQLPRYVVIKPGTHAYLRFWGVNAWENHPFSIAWIHHLDSSHLPVSETKFSAGRINRAGTTTTATFIINACTGLTGTLFKKASRYTEGIHIKATMEGPYAGYHNLESYGHTVLIAGAGGITHQVSYLQPLLAGSNAGAMATRRLTLIWIIRELKSLEWIRSHLDELSQISYYRNVLRVKVFVTRPQDPHGVVEINQVTRVLPGRPDIPLVLAEEIKEQIGAMCVSVCGPGALTDDVRDAVRTVQGASIVDFIEESFTW